MMFIKISMKKYYFKANNAGVYSGKIFNMKFPYCHHRHSSPDPNAPALEIQGLGVSYSSEGKFALKDFDISVPAGVAMALVGPNGAGKSTLFKAICGLLPIRSGYYPYFWPSFRRLPPQGGLFASTQ